MASDSKVRLGILFNSFMGLSLPKLKFMIHHDSSNPELRVENVQCSVRLPNVMSFGLSVEPLTLFAFARPGRRQGYTKQLLCQAGIYLGCLAVFMGLTPNYFGNACSVTRRFAKQVRQNAA
jgi:hypothetical protein